MADAGFTFSSFFAPKPLKMLPRLGRLSPPPAASGSSGGPTSMWTISSVGMECEFVVRPAGFGGEAAEPIHEGHLVVGGNFGEEEAIFGRSGGGSPEFAPSRRGDIARRIGECFFLLLAWRGKRQVWIDEYVVAAERAIEVTGDQRLGDWAGVLGRDVQVVS